MIFILCIKTIYKLTEMFPDKQDYKGLIEAKPVFGACDKARLKPVSSATETS